MLNISILGGKEHSVQSGDRTKAVQIWPCGDMYLPCQTWKVAAITASTSFWKQIVGSMLERVPTQATISESSPITFSDASFCKKYSYVCNHAA